MAKIIFDITEPYFDVNLTSNYNLSVLLGTDRFFFIITNNIQQILVQRTYAFPSSKSVIDFSEAIESIIKTDQALLYPYHTTTVTLIDTVYSLVPAQLYDDEKPELALLHTNFLSSNDYIFIDDIPSLAIKNVFTIPKMIFDTLKNHFANVVFHHFATAFITSTHSLTTDSVMFVNVKQEQLQVTAYKQQKLLLCNSYHYETEDEFLYYVMLVIQQLKLDNTVPIVLSGGITLSSSIYKKLSIYLKNLTFAARSSFYQFNETQFKEVDDHLFFDLYSIHALSK